MVKAGVWVKKDDPSVKIMIERVHKKKDTVDYFYFMCHLTGGGTMTKEELLEKYERVTK